MELTKRDCNIQMTLSRCKYCGQQGKLIVDGQEYLFATTDGLGQFFGRLIGIMSSFLGCCGNFDQQFLDRNEMIDNQDNGHLRLHGTMLWDCRGSYWQWHFVQDVDSCPSWREKNKLTLHVTEHLYGEKTDNRFTLCFPMKDFAYAVAKCATEVIKREGFWGYYNFAEKCEDFNVRQFLYLKAYALGVSEEMGYSALKSASTYIQDELELLMFDM